MKKALSRTEHYKNLVIPIIQKHLPHAKIILYGSRARQEDTSGSDIDIALDIGQKIESKRVNAIIEDLEESTLPINFDIVDLHNISNSLKEEILKDGIIWQ